MPNVPIVNLWTGLLAMGAVALLAACFIVQLREWGVRPLGDVSRWLHRPWIERGLLLFLICGMVQYAATKGTGNADPQSDAEAEADAVDEIEPTPVQDDDSQDPSSTEAFVVTNLCFTGISVLTNGVDLRVAWPANFLDSGTTLDFFAKHQSLTNAWQWFADYPISSSMTNVSVLANWQDDLGCATNPPMMFFKVQDRTTCAATMTDSDGDGLPDVYELHNGTNPYVKDSSLAPKLTVGDGGDYGTLAEALSASTNYSIVELSSSVATFDQTITLPSHPVLITGPQDGYARLCSTADIAMFLLDEGQGPETAFRNLYVILAAQGNFQAAFWIGGNLPWSGVGASPVFENVRVRALYPNVLHYGWHYYRDDGCRSSISNCVMNAAGSTSAIGVYSYNGPDVDVSDCAFVNFPTNDGCCAIWLKDGTNVVSVSPQVDTNLSWAGYALDGTYSQTRDSDGDGISDYDEVFIYDVDPWLPDSDGDGLTDAEEIAAGTDPKNLHSFYRRVTVVIDATDELLDTTNYVAWGTSATGWETNGLSCCWAFPSTNVYDMMSSSVPMYVKSFRDFNRNGQYDPEADIMLIEQVPSLDAVSTFVLRFGDVDGDGVADAIECQDGTDPFDAKNYCFNLSFVEMGVFCTTNALTAEVVFGTNVVAGPTILTDRIWDVNVGHLITSNREMVVAYFWDDANSNGVRDADERYTRQPLAIAGHENALTNTLAFGDFDHDEDCILDYWEILHADAGLSTTNAADAFRDADSDGLINLHEFWAGCDPAVPDGSNTVLSVAARSVDDRIRGLNATNALPIFEDYQSNGANGLFVPNTNCWLYGVDHSCASPWQNAGYGHQRAGTLISPRHLLTATHFTSSIGSSYWFMGREGDVYVRQTVARKMIGGSDLCVNLLNDDLPEEVSPACILPDDFARYIGNGSGLPLVNLDQEEKAIIQEADSMDAANGFVYGREPRDSRRAQFYEPLISGDSGNPRFLLIGDRLVLLNVTYSGQGGGGSQLTRFAGEMEDAMNELSGTNGVYRLQRIDLSDFELLQETLDGEGGES